MISITRHIEYLITCHDCVIVPGWGAFIANSTPARILDEGTRVSVLLPPMRTISFNPSINHNDGLLVTSLMRREGLGYDVALQEIENQVGHLRRELETEGEVSLPKIGSFTLNPEAPGPVFTPAPDSLADAPYFGLPRLRQALLPPLVVPASADEITEPLTATERYHLPTPIRRGLRRGLRVAASVALLIGLGIVISTPITVDKSTGNFASVDPSAALPKVTGPKAARIGSSYVPKVPEGAELSIVVPQPEAEEETESRTNEPSAEDRQTPAPTVAPKADSQTMALAPPAPAPGYYLIVASLESRNRAEK